MTKWSTPLITTALLLFCATAMAQDPPAEAVVPGELHVKMNTEYVKVKVDGEDWPQHEFSGDGRTLYVKELDRSKSHTITLTPSIDTLGAVTLTVEPDDFRKKRMKRRTYRFIAKKSAKFEPAKEDEPKEEAKDEPKEEAKDKPEE